MIPFLITANFSPTDSETGHPCLRCRSDSRRHPVAHEP